MRVLSLFQAIVLATAFVVVTASCSTASTTTATPKPASDLPAPKDDEKTRTAVFGMGCFWCAETVFDQLKGVSDVVSGYAGGDKATATYERYHDAGHAEAVKIIYDPRQITYGQLLQVLFTVGDATTKDGQKPDFGHGYRIAVFYEDDAQKSVAEAYIKQLTDSKTFDQPIAVTVEPMPHGFFPAEDYHQDFVKKHPDHPYVQRWSVEKVAKVRAAFKDWVKPK
jgi:peptide-methionine (S)-S-oxide reductase